VVARVRPVRGRLPAHPRCPRHPWNTLTLAGRSYAQIAEAAGLSRGRIHQLRHCGPAPEGAFLGVGGVIIATPLKQEARNARPVVAVEDFTAAQRLADLARTLQLDVEFEQVPLDGGIDLNRSNLIVICGPRLSDAVAEVLAQDPVIQFERAADGPWTLHDQSTDKRYRSGYDSNPPRSWDVAYLGRLPRPVGISWEPSATVVVLKLREHSVDYLVLADSVLVLDLPNELRVVSDDREAKVGRRFRAQMDSIPNGTPEHEEAHREYVENRRAHRNRSGGFWVASADPLAAEQALTGSVPRTQVHAAAVLSDGASRLVDRFGLATWEEALKTLDTHGPCEVLRQVRDAETNDLSGSR